MAAEQFKRPGTKASTTEVALLKDINSPFYNSLRVHGKLDSSPMELEFNIARPFADTIEQQIAAFQRSRHVTLAEATDAILREFVHIEPLYYDGTQPFIFCPATIPHEKNVEAPRLMYQWKGTNRTTHVLSVFLQRNLPLSTNHRGARFRLGIIFDFTRIGGSLNMLYTSSFEVLAKQGPSNKRKQLYWPEYEPVERSRAQRLKQVERIVEDHRDELYRDEGMHSYVKPTHEIDRDPETNEPRPTPNQYLNRAARQVQEGGPPTKRQKSIKRDAAVQVKNDPEESFPGQNESSSSSGHLPQFLGYYTHDHPPEWEQRGPPYPFDPSEENGSRSLGLHIVPNCGDAMFSSGSDTQTQTPQSLADHNNFTLAEKPRRRSESACIGSPNFTGFSHFANEPHETESAQPRASTPSQSESSFEEHRIA